MTSSTGASSDIEFKKFRNSSVRDSATLGSAWLLRTMRALMIMKEVLVEVLAHYIEKRYLAISDAIDIADAILRTNAKEIFGT